MRRFLAAALAAVLFSGLLPFQVLALTDQVITFDLTGLPAKTYGDASFDISSYASADSGLVVEFASLTNAVCAVSGTMVTLENSGDCTIEASQPGNDSFNPATAVDQSFTIGKAALSVTAYSPAAGVYGDPAPVITPIYGAFVGADDATVLDTAPTCTTTYAQGDAPATYGTSCLDGLDGNYAFSYIAGSFAIGKATLSVTADNKAITFGDPDPAFSFTYGSFVGADGAGVIDTPPTCGVSGDHAGVSGSPYPIICSGGLDGNYAFSYIAGSLTVGRAGQTISFTSTPPSPGVVGGATYVVSATGGLSGNPVTFTIDAGSATVCTIAIDGVTVSFIGAGTCTVLANQAGDADYGAALTVRQDVTVALAAQTISFGPLAPRTYGDTPFTVSGTGGGSGNSVVFTTLTSGVCTVSGTTVTIVTAGTCTIHATQAGDLNYADAPPVDQSFTVVKGAQTINFSSTPPTDAVIGGTYAVTATATSPLAVAFSSATGAICSVSGSTVTFLGIGTCTVNASQVGDANWSPAPSQQQSVIVNDRAPVCPSPVSQAVVMNVAVSSAAGCTDPEGDVLAYAIVTSAAHGTAAIGGSGAWTYTPAANYAGPDTFTFRASDGTLRSNPVTVALTVTNHPVDARNDSALVIATATTRIDVIRTAAPAGSVGRDDPGAGDTGQPMGIIAVTQGTKGRVTTDGTTVTYDPTGCATGTDLFTYTLSDGLTTDTASVVVTIARPGTNGLTTRPLTDQPVSRFVAGSTLGATVPVQLSWCGVTASATTLRGYAVQQSTNAGRTWAALLSGTTKATTTRSLAVGTTYLWHARTTDGAGRTGSWVASPSARVWRYQDSGSAIAYSAGWKVSTTTSASGGSERYTTRAGASATITLSNVRQFAIVGPRSSTRGSFEVWVDGVKVATVSERATTTVYRRVLYVRSLTAGAGVRHVIRIRAVSSARIDLDTVLALS